ncbi:MAG: VacJ family lipoprotein [bacterium]|nr:VacJ family lipoprotein [bacterium]
MKDFVQKYSLLLVFLIIGCTPLKAVKKEYSNSAAYNSANVGDSPDLSAYRAKKGAKEEVSLAALDISVVAGAWDLYDQKDEFDDEFIDEFGDEFEDKAIKDVFDPLVGYNRLMTGVNDKLYFWLVKPVARGYRYIVPEPARLAVGRFFENILFPVRFANNILQFKFKGAGVELSRFCVNSTVGILGLTDPAKEWWGLEAYPEDFGQTLGYYGVGGGFPVVLPFFGPSNVRDLVGMVPDYYANPNKLVETDLDELAIRSYDVMNNTSLHIGEYETLRSDALDLYTFLRDVYEQNRKKKIEE